MNVADSDHHNGGVAVPEDGDRYRIPEPLEPPAAAPEHPTRRQSVAVNPSKRPFEAQGKLGILFEATTNP